MTSFLLAHGAWHGGWCWRRVAERLRGAGHDVFTPTFTGLGERAHLLSPAVGIQTFVQDLLAVIETEELCDLVLVGHSFAGTPLSLVAAHIPDRLRHLVYLDATVIEDGQCALDILPRELVDARHRQARETSGGLTLPAPPATAFGLSDPADIAWLERRLTPHPFRTFTDRIALPAPPGSGLPRSYVACNDPPYPALAGVREQIRARPGWNWAELAAGHDAMVTAPAALAALLLRLAA